MDPIPGAPDPMEGGEQRDGGPPAGLGGSGGGPDAEHGPPADEDGPFFAWLPPEDRLWRHPSEATPASRPGAAGPDPRPHQGVPFDRRTWAGILPARSARGTWGIALVAGLIGALAVTAVGAATGMWDGQTTVVRSVVPATSTVSISDLGAEPLNWTTAVDDSVAASVVTISVDGAAGPAVGSGLLLVSSYGRSFIVTDRSLFAPDQAAGYMGSIEVSFLSGATASGHLVGQDPLSGLAVVEVPTPDGEGPPDLGSVADLQEAEPVLAVGARTDPYVSTGSVSGEDRSVDLPDGTDLDGLVAVTMPQPGTAAAGGPLLDEYGQVVGITLNLDPVSATDQQFTFAVPVDEVTRVASQIIDRTAVTHPWLGITDAADLPSAMAHQMDVPGGVQAGTVLPRGPAGEAGMAAHDVITSLDGRPVVSTGALMADINSCIPGRPVTITYVHSGRTVQSTVRPAEEPADS